MVIRLSYALEKQLALSVSRTVRRKQDIRRASRLELAKISVEPDDSKKDRLRKLFIILNIMRIGKVFRYENPAADQFVWSEKFICTNEHQNIYFDRSTQRVPLDAARFISDLVDTFDMFALNKICLKSISFECMKLEILAHEPDSNFGREISEALSFDGTRVSSINASA